MSDERQASERTQFDYLLNAFEFATQASKPAREGYAEKREALYRYVRALESSHRRVRVLTTELRDIALDAGRIADDARSLQGALVDATSEVSSFSPLRRRRARDRIET